MTKEELTEHSNLLIVDKSRIGVDIDLRRLYEDEFFSGGGRFNLLNTLDEEFETALYYHGFNDFLLKSVPIKANDYQDLQMRYIKKYEDGEAITEEIYNSCMEFFYELLKRRKVLYISSSLGDALRSQSREYNHTLKDVLAFSKVDARISSSETTEIEGDAFDVACSMYKKAKEKNPDTKYRYLDDFMSRYLVSGIEKKLK